MFAVSDRQVNNFGAHRPGNRYSDRLSPDETVQVKLKLTPVGSRVKPGTAAELLTLVHSLLETLAALHALGLCHRDIRRDNIIWYKGEWLLIDWELAGPADEKLPYRIKRVPDEVAARVQPYTKQCDLWQVRRLLHVLTMCKHAHRALPF